VHAVSYFACGVNDIACTVHAVSMTPHAHMHEVSLNRMHFSFFAYHRCFANDFHFLTPNAPCMRYQ
jgi:hypothetical protein